MGTGTGTRTVDAGGGVGARWAGVIGREGVAPLRGGGALRVALVSEHASPLTPPGGTDAGGQNVHVAALAEALARQGHDVTVFTRRSSEGQPARVVSAPGVTVVHIDAGPPQVCSKDDLLPWMGDFAAELAREWSSYRPDVVHAHFWMSGLASLAVARPIGVPVVQTFHALGVVKRRHQGAEDPSPSQRPAVEADLARTVDHIVATCSDEVDELIAMGADPARLSVVPCGVDLELFDRQGPAAPRHSGRHRLLAIGRLVARKGVDDIVRSLPYVPGAELLVAGGPALSRLGDDPEAARIREVARRSGVDGRVQLLGQVARSDMPALIRSADLLVCTPWYEPFGMAPLEAMACGVPVVVRPVGGLAETVRPGVTGLHVADVRPEVLGGALAGLLDDAGRRATMASAAYRLARRSYSWDRVASLTAEVYARTTESVGGSRP
jgi:D-inositol-3-phosphate glycosyltransferase